MRKPVLSLAVPLIAIALAITAFAVVPSVLNSRSPNSTASPQATSDPAWKVGDTWTYNLSFGSIGADAVMPREIVTPLWGNASNVFATLTETVVGNVSTSEGAAFNVTEKLTFLMGHDASVGMQTVPTSLGNVTGFVWFRQSDLAPLYARKAVHIVRTWNVTMPMSGWSTDHNGTYTLTYDAGTEVWFHPGLAVLQFPLAENATYNVTSNVTVHRWSSFAVSGPNVTFGSSHFSNVTFPIGFGIHTGFLTNVTTPAGNFSALPVSAYRHAFTTPTWGNDTDPMTDLALTVDCMAPRPLATGWFSAAAGNFVKADLGFGGFAGIELTLVSYKLG